MHTASASCEALSSSETFSQGQSGNDSFYSHAKMKPNPASPHLASFSVCKVKDEPQGQYTKKEEKPQQWKHCGEEQMNKPEVVQTSCCFWWRVLICGKANKNQFYMRGRVEIKGFASDWWLPSDQNSDWWSCSTVLSPKQPSTLPDRWSGNAKF